MSSDEQVRPAAATAAHIRIARPSRDLAAAERFWTQGLGLLVLYLDGTVPETLVRQVCEAGGTRVGSRNPYWDEWGVTIEDPDGYRSRALPPRMDEPVRQSAAPVASGSLRWERGSLRS